MEAHAIASVLQALGTNYPGRRHTKQILVHAMHAGSVLRYQLRRRSFLRAPVLGFWPCAFGQAWLPQQSRSISNLPTTPMILQTKEQHPSLRAPISVSFMPTGPKIWKQLAESCAQIQFAREISGIFSRNCCLYYTYSVITTTEDVPIERVQYGPTLKQEPPGPATTATKSAPPHNDTRKKRATAATTARKNAPLQ